MYNKCPSYHKGLFTVLPPDIAKHLIEHQEKTGYLLDRPALARVKTRDPIRNKEVELRYEANKQ
jgi:hypothetical protein